ncbi:MAG: GldG family protein, partial [Opitutaceae bacterium]
MKFGSKTIAIVLLLIGLVLVNYLATSIPLRLDATAESIYTLSAGTKKMLGKIEEPVAIDLYYSKDASGLPISYKNYAVRVQEMLRQYVRASRGKVTLNIINPRPDTPEEEKATASGLQPQVAQQGGEPFYFGLIVTQADQQKT